jgi:hypothetical protein
MSNRWPRKTKLDLNFKKEYKPKKGSTSSNQESEFSHKEKFKKQDLKESTNVELDTQEPNNDGDKKNYQHSLEVPRKSKRSFLDDILCSPGESISTSNFDFNFNSKLKDK